MQAIEVARVVQAKNFTRFLEKKVRDVAKSQEKVLRLRKVR